MNEKDQTFTILVMGDGETWGDVNGASICIITRAAYDKLCTGYPPKDLGSREILVEIGLRIFT